MIMIYYKSRRFLKVFYKFVRYFLWIVKWEVSDFFGDDCDLDILGV